MGATAIRIGCEVFAFRRRDSTPGVDDLYLPFVEAEPPSPVDGCYEVVDRLPVHAALSGDTLWEGPTWRMQHLADGRHCVEVRGPGSPVARRTAVLSRDFAEGEIRPLDARSGELSACVTQYPTDRIVLVNRLAHLGRLVLHAAGVLLDGRVLLFCGRSQVGKSTLARICRETAGAVLLNDDRMVVGIGEKRVTASAAPWHGKDPQVRTGTYPLGAIFHLLQSPRHRMEPIGRAAALARLMATSAAPFYNAEAMRRLTSSTADIIEHVSSFHLAFRPDAGVMDLVSSTL